MRDWKRIFAALLVVVLLCSMQLGFAAYAEGDDAADDDAGDGDAGGADGQDPDEVMPGQPEVPVPIPDPEPTPVPTDPPADPTQAPAEEEPTPIQTEEQGDVNLTLYTFTDSDTPASGYSVTLGGYSQTADSQGLVQFRNLPIGEYPVRITSPDGSACSGRLYMSRGSATVLTEQAMGGTYGMNIQRGQRDVYMVTTFVPDGALFIRSLTNTMPSLPEQAAPEPVKSEDIRYGEKTVTATFSTEDGTPVAGLALHVEAEGFTEDVTTDSRGQAVLRNMPYGACTITATLMEAPLGQFTLTMNPAQRTAILSNSMPAFVVDSSVTAKTLYLEFRQAGDTIVLTSASDEPIGGMNSLLIGVLVVGGIAAATIVLLVVARKKRRSRKARMRPTVRTNVRRGAQQDESDGVNDASDPQVRLTGGTNKFHDNSFDDRSRM